MPQIQAADDAAHDEPKTYNDEKGLENWEQDARLELENVKGDLVQQGDPEPQDQSYDVSHRFDFSFLFRPLRPDLSSSLFLFSF